MDKKHLKGAPLGKTNKMPNEYAPNVLFKIPRVKARKEINAFNFSFNGYDRWTCYELYWLKENGIPEVGCLEIFYNADSEYIVESKSLKLFLGSIWNTKFSSNLKLLNSIKEPLELLLNTKVTLKLYNVNELKNKSLLNDKIICIDNLENEKENLSTKDKIIEETFYSHILRSCCPVTNQPDYGTLIVDYKGEYINKKFIIELLTKERNFTGFHEQCAEKIYLKLLDTFNLKELYLACAYTRRGGIDITPVRFTNNYKEKEDIIRITRQ